MKGEKRAYTIDVCKTCGQHAIPPFSCGHRPKYFHDPDKSRWTKSLTVRGTFTPDLIEGASQ